MKAALILALALAAAFPAQDEKPADPKTPPPKVSLPPAQVKPAVNDALLVCQASCSRAYYFCLSESDADVCAPSWNQCRANCVRNNP